MTEDGALRACRRSNSPENVDNHAGTADTEMKTQMEPSQRFVNVL
jgi:hypothetical protein